MTFFGEPVCMLISSGGNVPVWDIKPLGLLKLRVERSPAPCPLYQQGVRFLHSVETLRRVSKSAEVGL